MNTVGVSCDRSNVFGNRWVTGNWHPAKRIARGCVFVTCGSGGLYEGKKKQKAVKYTKNRASLNAIQLLQRDRDRDRGLVSVGCHAHQGSQLQGKQADGQNAQASTLNIIEWHVVCQYVAGFCQTKLGQEMCLEELCPPENIKQSQVKVEETKAVQKMQEQYIADFDFGGILTREARDGLNRAKRGGMLNGAELLAVASVVNGVAKLQRKVRECAKEAEMDGETEDIKLISDMFLEYLGDVPTTIASDVAFCLEHGGQVREGASDDVRKAAGKVRTLENRLRGILKNHGDEIEEHGGRLCVLVPAMKGNLPPKGSVQVGTKIGGSVWIIEPSAAVNINNDLVSARNSLKIAEEAVLWKLTNKVRDMEPVLDQCLRSIIWLDSINARFRFGKWISGTLVTDFEPFAKTGKAKKKGRSSSKVQSASQETTDSEPPESLLVHMRQLRHPVLTAEYLLNSQKKKSGDEFNESSRRLPGWRKDSTELNNGNSKNIVNEDGKPVPIDVFIGKDIKGVIITGPNTGGKTAALKSIGLACLMAKCGIPVPAEYPIKVPFFDQILADIGDEQSLSANLSTFSSHLKRIEKIRKESTGQSLVLLDELGTGTDAIDGAALGIAIMQIFAEGGRGGAGLTLATTHHSALTSLKYDEDVFENASVEFDEVNLKPTYKLIWGVPGRSCALNIAERLHLDPEVVQHARQMLGQEAADVQDNLALLEQLRKEELDLMNETRRLEAKKSKVQSSIEKFSNEWKGEGTYHSPSKMPLFLS
eukprot:jgi/Picsp_1/1770/NSC_05242-R1_2 family protein